MRPGPIVMAVHVLDNADILREFLQWHLDLGIDIILANDFGSSDGSQDILEEFSRRSAVRWQRRTDKSAKDLDHSLVLAQQARDQLKADWIFLADTDEFLISDRRPLADILAGAAGDGFGGRSCQHDRFPCWRARTHAISTCASTNGT